MQISKRIGQLFAHSCLFFALCWALGCDKKKEGKESADDSKDAKYLRLCRHEHRLRLTANETLTGKKRADKKREDDYYRYCVEKKKRRASRYGKEAFEKVVECKLAAKDLPALLKCRGILGKLRMKSKGGASRKHRKKGRRRARKKKKKSELRKWMDENLKNMTPEGFRFINTFAIRGRTRQQTVGHFLGMEDEEGRRVVLDVMMSLCAPSCPKVTKEAVAKRASLTLKRFGEGASNYEVKREKYSDVEAVREWLHAFKKRPDSKFMPVLYRHKATVSWSNGETLLEVSARFSTTQTKKVKNADYITSYVSRKKLTVLTKETFEKVFKQLPKKWK